MYKDLLVVDLNPLVLFLIEIINQLLLYLMCFLYHDVLKNYVNKGREYYIEGEDLIRKKNYVVIHNDPLFVEKT